MSHTRIKICGITRQTDARAVSDSGADAMGLVFYPPSPRAVDPARAADIVAAAAPFLTVVALFVDPEPAQVQEVLRRVPVDLLQFHGNESPAFCASFDRPWMKALRVRPETDLVAEATAYTGGRAVLLDAWQPGVPGGTGKTFDWQLANRPLPLPLVLAGGLRPDNVGEAMAALQPAAVDVSGGVERSPGVKDEELIRRFVAAVRAADVRYGIS